MSEILSNDRQRLRLFDDAEVVIDSKLPKWVNAKKFGQENFTGEKTELRVRESYNNATISDAGTSTSSFYITQANPVEEIKTKIYGVDKDSDVFFDNLATASLKELSAIINEGNIPGIKVPGRFGTPVLLTNDWGSKDEKASFWKKIKRFFKKEDRVQFDAVSFFANVKLASKESAETYRDRVEKYLKALHNAKAINQTALLEKLTKEMIVNKYENLLYATGNYYAVTQKQIVDFAKKTEKGVSLCYIKNYARPIPEDVIEKIGAMNDLEIFDNYVILYYDPEGETYRETEKEKEKRRDPIIFGVIAGSDKLYYVTDWIDEYCDLTLEKFVDTLGITKDDLLIDEEDKKKAKKEIKEEEKKPEEKKKSRKKKTDK